MPTLPGSRCAMPGLHGASCPIHGVEKLDGALSRTSPPKPPTPPVRWQYLQFLMMVPVSSPAIATAGLTNFTQGNTKNRILDSPEFEHITR